MQIVTFTSLFLRGKFALHFNAWRHIVEDTLAIGIGYVAVLMPVLLVGVIFFFDHKTKKARFDTMIEISQNLQDPKQIRGLLEDLKEKKQPVDYRRSGVVTLFVGVGLFLFASVAEISIVRGVGLLVAAIGVGSIIAGYLYPNESAELTRAVEAFEEQ